MSEIDSRASVSPRARIGNNSRIGAFSVIGDDVELGDGCVLEPHVVINGPSRIGKNNHVRSFAALGCDPQDISYAGERVSLEIGDGNQFYEFVTVSRGTKKGGGTTHIGGNNMFMAYSHVAHDCHVGDHTIFVNGATLAGHVTVENHATVGAFCTVHQFCRVGRHAYVAALTAITQDVPPFSKVVQSRDVHCFAVNSIGLERHGFSPERIKTIERAYRLLLRSKLNTTQALERMKTTLNGSEDVSELIRFIEAAERGLVK
ncbi:MAG: acyl-ACP--UDP-N-acetylglucosamine O-acyltransferase [Candidatus Acidiferrales bacterium]